MTTPRKSYRRCVPLGRAADVPARVRCAFVVVAGPAAAAELKAHVADAVVFEENEDLAYAVLADAQSAVDLAEQLRDAVRTVAVHVGTALHQDDVYSGRSLVQALRVARSARTGVTVLTASAADALRGIVAVQDLGMHKVEGMPRPLRLYAA